MSAMAVSREKRFTILPNGFELKKSMGARAILRSIELWSVLLRWTKMPPIRKLVKADIKIAARESRVKLTLLSD